MTFWYAEGEHPSVFDDCDDYFLGGAQRAPKIDFGRVLGLFESPLGTSFRHVGGSVALLGHPLDPKRSQKRHDEGLKSDLGGSRGGQGVSEALNASILKRCSSLVVFFGVLLHVVSVRKVLCIMVAASHCNCFSQCVERGRGSAAGAAEDHMTCMLDALQCMGLSI